MAGLKFNERGIKMINRYSIKELKALKAALNRDEKFEEKINRTYEELKENAKYFNSFVFL